MPETISLEPNWDGIRKWVLHVHRTDPKLAHELADSMGREAPELPDLPPEPPQYRKTADE